VRIVLTRRGAALDGRVTASDGKPAPGAAVVVFGEAPAAWHPSLSTTRTATADENGRYTVPALPPGSYLVVALPRDQAATSGAPSDYFETLAGLATRVELSDSQTRLLDLRLATLPR
jgi:hypothetical protein